MHVRVRRRLLKQRRFRQLLFSLFILAILLGFSIVPLERTHPESHFQTRLDGVYWAVSTLTTVGYGDVVTVTTVGKYASIVLQLTGAMMFGLIIAMISSYVNKSQDDFYWGRLYDRLDRLEQTMDDLRKGHEFLVKDSHQTEANTTESKPKKPDKPASRFSR